MKRPLYKWRETQIESEQTSTTAQRRISQSCASGPVAPGADKLQTIWKEMALFIQVGGRQRGYPLKERLEGKCCRRCSGGGHCLLSE
jgi:hypothetical protein